MKAIRRLLKSTMTLVTAGVISFLFGSVPAVGQTYDAAADFSSTNNQCIQPPEGLIGWWPGDGNANDIQGTNNGTLQGGVTFGSGLLGRAFGFDGVDGLVSFGKTIPLNGTTSWPGASWLISAGRPDQRQAG